ncbi:MAG: FHA domain-containing protein [Acidobacteria bacterium]|nr:FHA domain-containing protein [Acidobacteriota bacterium]
MADDKTSILDKAETLARRVFERLGSKVDERLSKSTQEILSKRELDDLLTKIEHAIDANLQTDRRGIKRIAPHCFKVMFTYERTLTLNRKYFETLYPELKATILEYITNRRYETKGEIQISLSRDYFAKVTTVKAAYDAREISVNPTDNLFPARPTQERNTNSQTASPSIETSSLTLRDALGQEYRFTLQAGSQPACIGRAAGNRLRIEDHSISRVHCSFSLYSNGQVVLADLNSSNGTALNQQAIKPHEARSLKKGDVISVGDVRLTVVDLQANADTEGG